VYDISESGQPQLVYSAKLGEAVQALDGGYVTSASHADLLVHTFSGRVGLSGWDGACRGLLGLAAALAARASCVASGGCLVGEFRGMASPGGRARVEPLVSVLPTL
jgi:hypothetical protein